MEPEKGPPAGAESDALHVPAQEWSLECQSRFSLTPQDTLAIAYYDEVKASSVLMKYKADFLKRLGCIQAPRMQAASCAFSFHSSYRPMLGSRRDVQQRQLELFDHRRRDAAAAEPESVPAGSARARSECADAYLTQVSAAARPRGFVMHRITDLAHADPPVVLGEEQVDFFSLGGAKG